MFLPPSKEKGMIMFLPFKGKGNHHIPPPSRGRSALHHVGAGRSPEPYMVQGRGMGYSALASEICIQSSKMGTNGQSIGTKGWTSSESLSDYGSYGEGVQNTSLFSIKYSFSSYDLLSPPYLLFESGYNNNRERRHKNPKRRAENEQVSRVYCSGWSGHVFLHVFFLCHNDPAVRWKAA